MAQWPKLRRAISSTLLRRRKIQKWSTVYFWNFPFNIFTVQLSLFLRPRWGETVYLCTYLHKQNHTTCVSAVGCLPADSSFSAITEGERPAQVAVGVRCPAPTEALAPEPGLCNKSNHHSEKPAHHSWRGAPTHCNWRKAPAATTTRSAKNK